MEAFFLVMHFKFGKNGFVVRLPSFNEMIEDAGKLMSGVLDGLRSAVPCALRAVIVAQVGLIVVKGLSGQPKSLSDAVFGFDFRSADAASGTEAILGAKIQPGAETIVGWKFRQIGAEFTEDGLNAEAFEPGNEREIDTKDAL